MAIGRSIGYQYNLPQGLPQDQLGGGAIRGGLGAGQQMTPQGGVPVPEGLQWVDGQTGNIYQKWGELNQFAKTMKTQYGMDVTDPDYTDPQQVQISQAYQKGVADLYMNIDKFRNSQRMMEEQMKRGGFIGEYDPSQQAYAEQVGKVEFQGVLPETESIIESYQNVYSDPATRDQADEFISKHRKELMDRIAVETNASRRDQLKRSLEALKGAMLDRTKWMEIQERRIRRNREDMELSDQVFAFNQEVKSLQAGDNQLLKQYLFQGKPIYKDITDIDEDGNVSFKAIEFSEYNPDTGKYDIQYGDLETINVRSDAGIKRIMNLQRQYSGLDKINVGNVTRLGGYEGVDRTRKVGLVEAPALTAEAVNILDNTDTKKSKAARTEITKLLTDAVAEGTYELPVGIPQIDKPSWFADLESQERIGQSSGGEKIKTVEEYRNGFLFTDEDNNTFYIPWTKEKQEKFGKHRPAVESILKSIGYGQDQGSANLLIITRDGKDIVVDTKTKKALRYATDEDRGKYKRQE
jgi:hypothetical protein